MHVYIHGFIYKNKLHLHTYTHMYTHVHTHTYTHTHTHTEESFYFKSIKTTNNVYI